MKDPRLPSRLTPNPIQSAMGTIGFKEEDLCKKDNPLSISVRKNTSEVQDKKESVTSRTLISKRNMLKRNLKAREAELLIYVYSL